MPEVDPTAGGNVAVDDLALGAFMVGLLGLLLPIIPAIVALVLASRSRRRIVRSEGLLGGMGYVRGAQALAVANIIVAVGIVGAAILYT